MDDHQSPHLPPPLVHDCSLLLLHARIHRQENNGRVIELELSSVTVALISVISKIFFVLLFV